MSVVPETSPSHETGPLGTCVPPLVEPNKAATGVVAPPAGSSAVRSVQIATTRTSGPRPPSDRCVIWVPDDCRVVCPYQVPLPLRLRHALDPSGHAARHEAGDRRRRGSVGPWSRPATFPGYGRMTPSPGGRARPAVEGGRYLGRRPLHHRVQGPLGALALPGPAKGLVLPGGTPGGVERRGMARTPGGRIFRETPLGTRDRGAGERVNIPRAGSCTDRT